MLFGFIVRLRRLAYRWGLRGSHAAGVPVIVVGNLVAGGSGKTPLALWIAEFLKDAGWSPALLLRGYGGTSEAPAEVTLTSYPAVVGDEAVLLARRSRAPVWVGADRVEAARRLRAHQPQVDVLVLDDGLQHYWLRRDIEIAVIDARGFGNGWLLPAGPLREPPARLRSVDALVLHGAQPERFAQVPAAKTFSMRLHGDTLVKLGNALERRPLEAFAGTPVHAVAGIGDPGRFFRHLSAAGLSIVPHPFPDHHPFSPEELEFGDGAPVVMTEKDAVKLRGATDGRPDRDWWSFPVSAQLDPAFGPWLLDTLRAKSTSRTKDRIRT